MNTHVRERERCARKFEMVETCALRDRLEDTIEALIALLDAIDGDADLEPTFGDIPASGFDEGEEDDAEEDDGTREPSLGSVELYPSLAPCYRPLWDQRRWGHSSRSDRELDAGDQPELDEGESGIADLDALLLIEATMPAPPALY